MGILGTRPKKRKRRIAAGYLGTYVPKSLADYVTLYCNALEITKISIIKQLLTDWETQATKKFPNSMLEAMIAEKAYECWNQTEGQSFETFMKMLQFELKKKKLEPEVVGRIIKMIEDEKNKITKK